MKIAYVVINSYSAVTSTAFWDLESAKAYIQRVDPSGTIMEYVPAYELIGAYSEGWDDSEENNDPTKTSRG